MQVLHPQGSLNGVPPEDTFIAVDDIGTQLGMGYIFYQFQPHRCPDCPINMYFSLESQPAARYILLGALVARARLIRDNNTGVGARLYTNIAPGDTRARNFYLQSGFSCDDAELEMEMPIPAGEARIPMSCAIVPTPLNTAEECAGFLARLQQNDITYLDMPYLTSLLRQPHVQAQGLLINNQLSGEVLLAGTGSSCELAAIYIIPANRRLGLAMVLLHQAMMLMGLEGVARVNACVMSDCEPQMRLVNAFQARNIGTRTVVPSIRL